jgi:hypothetical protein
VTTVVRSRRLAAPDQRRTADVPPRRRTGWARRVAGWLLTLLALGVVWFALVAPDRLDELGGRAFVRLPLELVVLAALALVLPARAWRVVAVVAGVLLAVVSVFKVADMGFFEVLDRPFDPVIDWTYLDSAVGVVDASAGRAAAVAVSVVAGVLALALLCLTPWALLRLGRVVRGHRRPSMVGIGVTTVAFTVLALLGTQTAYQLPVASTDASQYVWGEVAAVPRGLADQREFARAAESDPLRGVPADQLFGALRGKDVLLVFVESYGRVAVQDPTIAPGVDAVLDTQTSKLAAKGFGARSAFLTSPTFGAGSWLAHATTQSGLWVENQQRYDVLVTSPRLTLSDLFHEAGWRTVSDVPANTHDWPQGAFYGYDQEYDARNVGYRGPKFGYPTMPDQYTLDAFRRLELDPTDRKPVFGEIDLISSHASWSTLPRMIPWSEVGDGSAFEGMPEQSPPKSETWQDAAHVQQAYGRSIEYSLTALYSWVRRYGDDDTVLVVLGDHQPATIVSGADAGHDVPVSVVAHDPKVLRRIDGWGWQQGLRPSPTAPVWRMDSFRDRFVKAYGP